jgi:hypothetical protein
LPTVGPTDESDANQPAPLRAGAQMSDEEEVTPETERPL